MVKLYSIVDDRWTDYSYLPFALCDHVAVVIGDDCYVIGGYIDKWAVTDIVMVLSDGEWRTLCPMPKSVRFQSAVVDKGHI